MFEVLLHGMALGVLFAIAGAVVRANPPNAASRTCALLCLAAAGFVAQSSPQVFAMLGPLRPLAWLLAAGTTGCFWLFAMALFGRERLRLKHAAAPALLVTVAIASYLLPAPSRTGADVVHNLIEVALIAHVAVEIWLGRGDDLVDRRLAMRLPFMALLVLVELVFAGFDFIRLLGRQQPWMEPVQAIALAGVTLLAALTFVEARAELFASPGARKRPGETELATLSAADRQLIERLGALLGDPEFWRRPGLGIAATAEQIGAPEYRVRQLINRHLGYRNFSDFLNERRIAMAKQELRDPAKALVQISTIAFDLGYASLGPFNRAFREMTGMTPREWRETPAVSSG